MENQFLNDINIILIEMKNNDSIKSQSILHQITKTIQHLNAIKTYWFEYENTDGFYFYKTVCNIESILFRIRLKFKDFDDRKKIINDVITILPYMDKLLGMLKPRETIKEKEIDDVLDQTKLLHDMAFMRGLVTYAIANEKSADKTKIIYKLITQLDT